MFESQGVQAVSVVSAPAEDRSLFLQSPFSLLLVEPASCYGDAELMEAVRSQRHRVVFFGSEVKAAYVDLAIRSRVRGFVSTQGALAQIVKRVSQLTSGELQEYWCPEAEELIDLLASRRRCVPNRSFLAHAPAARSAHLPCRREVGQRGGAGYAPVSEVDRQSQVSHHESTARARSRSSVTNRHPRRFDRSLTCSRKDHPVNKILR